MSHSGNTYSTTYQQAPTRRELRNTEQALRLDEAMYAARSRYLILVLTLSYKDKYRDSITLNDIRRDRERFFGNFRHNQLLHGIDAYVWKIEEGENSGGLHLHVLIFYAGEHRADIYIAQRIGEYWENVITKGKGSYWNSNTQKEMHERYGHGIGTGQIDRHDKARREALRENMRYLAKGIQRATGTGDVNCRMFGMSQLPKKPRFSGKGTIRFDLSSRM